VTVTSAPSERVIDLPRWQVAADADDAKASSNPITTRPRFTAAARRPRLDTTRDPRLPGLPAARRARALMNLPRSLTSSSVAPIQSSAGPKNM
jgi:hypothetical protein